MDLKKLAYVVLPAAAVALGVFAVISHFVQPLPPRHITLSTGREGGAYHAFGQQYARLAAADGFTIDILPGAGSVETLQRLGAGEVMAGFVQGGVAETVPTDAIRGVASLYYEPVWLFHRRAHRVQHLDDLRGRRVHIGEEGSGVRPLALRLLRESGVTADNATFLGLGSEAAAAALEAGRIDAAFFVMAPTVPLVRRLLLHPGVELWSASRVRAFTTRARFLSTLTLGEGVIDLPRGAPAHDVTLLAAAATLAVRADVHPVIVRLLVKIAESVHGPGGVFEAPNAFPSDSFVDLPLHEVARRTLRRGPAFLERFFPFWLAVTLERWALLILPSLGLLLPLIRILPELYNARVRSRVTRWYRVVNDTDKALSTFTPEEARAAAARLRDVQDELTRRSPPPTGLMGEFYDLKLHLEWLLRRTEAVAAAGGEPPGLSSPPTPPAVV
jgi:uncharacterized protein